MSEKKPNDPFIERAKEKQIAREQDARDLASGAKSREQLRQEIGLVVDPARMRIDITKAKRVI